MTLRVTTSNENGRDCARRDGAETIELNRGRLKPQPVLVPYMLDEKVNPPAKLVRSLELLKPD